MRLTICLGLKLGAAAFAFMILAGCAPTLATPEVSEEQARREAERQLDMAFTAAVRRESRLFRVGWPLMVAASDLCKNHNRPFMGFLVHDKESYAEEFRPAAERRYGLGRGVYVSYVHPTMAAARAGLKPGDLISSVGERRVGELDAFAVWEMINRATENQAKLVLWVEREGGALVEIKITGIKACAYRLVLVIDDRVNAFADGSNVGVTSGMIRFVESDGELALVTAHEISHNAYGHIEKLQGNVLLGSLLDLFVYGATGVNSQGLFGQLGRIVYSKAFESEADYAGLYIAARAGYDITDAAQFWRRMAVEHPGSIKDNFLSTHPSTPRRFIAIENTVEEIEEKRALDLPLIPNHKGEKEEEG